MNAERFKQALKDDGRSIKWFYDNKINGNIDIGYSGFTAQLNGYAGLSEDVEKLLVEYVERTSKLSKI